MVYTKTRYDETVVTPTLDYRESKHLEFLQNAAIADKPIVADNKQNREYPSYLVALELVSLGYLDANDLDDNAHGKQGYEINDNGRALLRSLELFNDGKIIDDEPIIEYWKQVNPARLSQMFVNRLFAGQINPDTVRGEYVDTMPENSEYADIERGAIDAMTAMSALWIVPADDLEKLANVHSPSEVGGGRIGGRLTGFAAHCRKVVEEETGITSETELIQYLFTVAYAVVMHNKNVGDEASNKVFKSTPPESVNV